MRSRRSTPAVGVAKLSSMGIRNKREGPELAKSSVSSGKAGYATSLGVIDEPNAVLSGIATD